MIGAAGVLLLAGCAPTWSHYCKGLPDVRNLSAQESATEISNLSDEEALDLVACQLSTSHPPHLSFPDELITSRRPSMALVLLNRLRREDEGFISGTYADYLATIVSKNQDILPANLKAEAYQLCAQRDGILCSKIK